MILSFLDDELKKDIEESIVKGVGALACPQEIYFVETMPKTVSGKIMRRLLKEVQVKGSVAGDVTGLEDPTAIEHVIDVVSSGTDAKV